MLGGKDDSSDVVYGDTDITYYWYLHRALMWITLLLSHVSIVVVVNGCSKSKCVFESNNGWIQEVKAAYQSWFLKPVNSQWNIRSCNSCIMRIPDYGIKIGLLLLNQIHAVKKNPISIGLMLKLHRHMLKLTYFW